ncbi:MAG: glycosyltransferase family 9 protein [Alphaproteobacteria bacterium]|nr:glycosyltransferase family 9 protein [Alphaproteobacteria bacterium]
MTTDAIVLNLPKDLGDCLLSVPAIAQLRDYAAREGIPLVAVGHARSRDWVETLGGFKLETRDGDALLALNPRFAVNLNFYDPYTLGKTFPDAPVYAPEKLRVLENDEKDFGAGAVIGKKHVSLLLQDMLQDMGVLGINQKLQPPQLPAEMLDDAAISAAKMKFGIAGKYALLVPVAAANRPLKKWPKENYVAVAKDMLARGITPVLIGGPSAEEKSLCAEIAAMTGGGLDVCGQTSLPDIAALAKGAQLTLGNDTGPTHIAAVTGAPVFAFFGYYSDPATWKPVTPNNSALVLTGKPVPQITVAETLSALRTVLEKTQNPARAFRVSA